VKIPEKAEREELESLIAEKEILSKE